MKATVKLEKKTKEAIAAKGTDKDPKILKGPGGAIPMTLEQIADEKAAAEEAKEEEEKDKGKAAEKYSKTCDKCRAEDIKKEHDRPKRVNERYDAKFDPKDTMHHSGVDAHDTKHDYDQYGNYYPKMESNPGPKRDNNKPLQPYYNPEDTNGTGRIWKPTHDTTLNDDAANKAEAKAESAKAAPAPKEPEESKPKTATK